MEFARTVEPGAAVSLADVKRKLRITDTDRDAELTQLERAAAQWVEESLGIALITQTLQGVAFEIPDDRAFRLNRPPLQSVSLVEYRATDGTWTTLAASKYDVDTISHPGTVTVRSDSVPATHSTILPSWRITWVCGMAADASTLSDEQPAYAQIVKQAVEEMFDGCGPEMFATRAMIERLRLHPISACA